ncbi:heterokaryon incompatibility protein-domain-containing protein [Annulohypoxylon moriforme]|nr:heterokaryon incompatibility protein-domain-containing protein [Annulohypoxylon moriforme]
MRLLHASGKEFKEFIIDGEIPPYAILSHTWGDEEISFQDMRDIPLEQLSFKKGYKKIFYCCVQAFRDDLEWIWVDTCCIDKSSSAELSESINSMFRWYQDSKICYAYLSDVSGGTTMAEDSEFSKSRWFTRGWTLQELIAPAILRFYSADWCLLGTKYELCEVIHSITHIEPKFLDCQNLDLASTAKKMSWASSRSTSRLEDVAYSLLGIFDVNMPLIYGEGKKAFRRLQEEIIKIRYFDHSIFAWGTIVSKPSMQCTDKEVISGTKEIPWSEPEPLLGLLAESPRDFKYSGKFVPAPVAESFYGRPEIGLPILTGSNIHIQLPIIGSFASVHHWKIPKISQLRWGSVVLLLCCSEDLDRMVQIPLERTARLSLGRTNELLLDNGTYIKCDSEPLIKRTLLRHIVPEKQRTLGCGDVVIQRDSPLNDSSMGFNEPNKRYGVVYYGCERVVVVNGHLHGRLLNLNYMIKAIGEDYGLTLGLKRLAQADVRWGPFCVELVPVLFNKRQGTGIPVDYKGIRWYSPGEAWKPLFAHTMATPSDTWELDSEPLPVMSIGVKREIISEDIFIDVVNIIVYDRPDTPDGPDELESPAAP